MPVNVRTDYTEAENKVLASIQGKFRSKHRPTDQREIREFETDILDKHKADLIPILERQERKRLVLAFRRGAYATTSDAHSDIQVSLLFGYWRALLYAWMDEQGFDNSWLVGKRKEHKALAKNGRDRNRDVSIFLLEVGDPDDYYPKMPLDIYTIMELARQEFCMMMGMFTANKPADNGALSIDAGHTAGTSRKHAASIDEDYHYLMSNAVADESDFDCPAILKSEDELSPALILVAERFVCRFGPRQTVYWLCNKLFYKGNIPELLKAFGANPTDKGFEAMERDLRRKLPQMDEALAEFKTNKELLAAFEHLIDV